MKNKQNAKKANGSQSAAVVDIYDCVLIDGGRNRKRYEKETKFKNKK